MKIDYNGEKLSSCIFGVHGKRAGGNGKHNLLLFEPKDTSKSFSGSSCSSTRSRHGGFYYTHFTGKGIEAQGDTARNW